MMSGPRRLVLLTLRSDSWAGASGGDGAAAGGAAVELLDGPDVWSAGFPSTFSCGAAGGAAIGSSISTSGISFADALYVVTTAVWLYGYLVII